MSFNPYQPPTSAYDGNYTNSGNNGAAVSDRTVASLRKTRPWVVLISVVLFVTAGLTVLGAFGAMATLGAGIGIAYIVAAALYVVPAVAMTRYSIAINKLLHGGGGDELDEAMEAQASFWQISGIITLVGIVLGILAIIGAVAIGASMMKGF